MRIRIRRGLDIGLPGAPAQVTRPGPSVKSVALLGADYPGLRFTIHVEPGQTVKRGDAVMVDRHRPEIAFCAPAAGTVTAINRGPRRSLSSLVIAAEGDAAVSFDTPENPNDREATRAVLLQAGQWPAFIRRPYGRIPDADEVPDAIFVTAMDSNPLSADAATVIADGSKDFRRGVTALAALTDGDVVICHSGNLDVAGFPERVRGVTFSGRHPAGLPGTHIHRVAPVGGGRVVWQIGYQDVIAIGHLLENGEVSSERVIALAGAGVREPGLVRTVAGADIDDLVEGQLAEGRFRLISGSVYSGRAARYLGRYHTAVAAIPETTSERLPNPLRPPSDTSQHGFGGPFIPVAAHERVFPMDLLVAPLLRALTIGDEEEARRLGVLELLEEDVAVLSYICPSKINYAPLLRGVLDKLEEAG